MTEETAQAIELVIARESESTVVSSATQVGFKRLTKDAVIPTKAHASDSGFDLVASEDVIVEPGETVVVLTGVAVSLPAGYEATVRPRSGVTAKTKLRVQLGTIDNGFSGGLGVIVDNVHEILRIGGDGQLPLGKAFYLDGTETERIAEHRHGTYLIRKNDRIAQLVITRLPDVEAVEVFDVGDSARGANGFGSSGVSAE